MLAWMLLLHIGNPFIQTCDVLETNHRYDEQGRYIFTQVLAWNYDASDGKLHCIGWQHANWHFEQVHRSGGLYFVRAKTGFITSTRHMERWLMFDIERQDSREFWKRQEPNVFEKKTDEEYRVRVMR